MIIEEKSKTDVRLALDGLVLTAETQMERECLLTVSGFIGDSGIARLAGLIEWSYEIGERDECGHEFAMIYNDGTTCLNCGAPNKGGTK